MAGIVKAFASFVGEMAEVVKAMSNFEGEVATKCMMGENLGYVRSD